MTGAELAAMLEVSEATVSRIASGERRPSVDLILSIRRVLGWSFESQAMLLAESAVAYGTEFKARMDRKRVVRDRA